MTKFPSRIDVYVLLSAPNSSFVSFGRLMPSCLISYSLPLQLCISVIFPSPQVPSLIFCVHVSSLLSMLRASTLPPTSLFYCFMFGKLSSSSVCNFLHPPVTSSLQCSSTLLNTPFSETNPLRPSLKVRD